MWINDNTSVMSEEEELDSNSFKVHRPSWQSDTLKKLLDDLDERAMMQLGTKP